MFHRPTQLNTLALGKKAVIGVLAMGIVGGSALGLGSVGAVDLGAQTVKYIMGTRATTSEFTTVTAAHNGISVASSSQAGAAAASITPSTTDATTEVRLGTVTAGDYVYSVKFESASVDDDIPSGTLNARWQVNGTEYTKSLSVSTATVGASDKGGFTIVLPGSAQHTPDSIQVVFQQ